MLIFRFLHIASLAHLCSLLFKMTSCHSLPVNLEKEARAILLETHNIRRTYKLYNECSGKHVQIFGKTVNAKGFPDSPHVNLSFISVRARHSPNAMNIKCDKSGRYLCFNKKGRLITRINGSKRLCLFKEGFSENHYTVLQSVHNHTWYVGFNKRGRALKGNMYSKPKLRDCFHFVKREHNYTLQETHQPGPNIIPSKFKDLLPPRGLRVPGSQGLRGPRRTVPPPR